MDVNFFFNNIFDLLELVLFSIIKCFYIIVRCLLHLLRLISTIFIFFYTAVADFDLLRC